jgi:hypothetical protein
MNVLKGLGTGIFSFLLFLSLSVFGVAFLINSTILNPDFVVAQVDKLDMTTLARDYVDEQISEDLPQEAEFPKEATYDIIADREPWLKAQFGNAVYAGYDFFLGKSDRFEINIPLDDLKADIKKSLWQTLQKFLSQKASLIPEDLLMPYVDEHYQELIGLIPKQLLPPGMAGLTGEQLKTYLDQHYDEVTSLLQTAYLVPGVSILLLDQIQPYFDRYYDEFVDDFPASQVIDENEISADVMEQLRLARKSIGYFHTGYYALIAFMILLVAGIILINRNVRDISRALGIVFLIYGVAEFAGILFARYFDFIRLIPDLPSSLETWLSNLIKDTLVPLQWFSLGILVLGVVLIVVSIVSKPRTSLE